MLGNLGGWHFLVIMLVLLLIFGATKLPALARGVGQSVRILRTEVAADENAGSPSPSSAAATGTVAAAADSPSEAAQRPAA